MRAGYRAGLLLAAASFSAPVLPAQTALPQQPRVLTYREVAGRALVAHVFAPTDHGERTSAILLFHGGGWSDGSPEWVFEAARRFASVGMLAIAIEYRLSEGQVTPIDALDDVCAAIAWARGHARELGYGGRVAGYGVSAGGHLVAATATVGCRVSGAGRKPAGPDALVLWSPALDVASDGWFQQKLQNRGRAAEYSPVEHVGPATPPTSIVHGDKDTLTPLSGSRRFCRLVVQAGGVCELNVYPGVGHLLTRNLANQESDFDPDPRARDDGIARQLRFLRTLGFVSGQ